MFVACRTSTDPNQTDEARAATRVVASRERRTLATQQTVD